MGQSTEVSLTSGWVFGDDVPVSIIPDCPNGALTCGFREVPVGLYAVQSGSYFKLLTTLF